MFLHDQTDPGAKHAFVARRVAALVATIAITFHWIPNYWWSHTHTLLAGLPEMWTYGLSLVCMGFLLTVWSPTTFGLTWAQTWSARRVAAGLGGLMIGVAAVTMLFVRVPFYGGSPAIYFCIPLAEELIFRGFLFAIIDDAFRRDWSFCRTRVSTATVLTAIAFGLWHLGGLRWPTSGFIVFQITYTMIAGVLLGVIRERTGSIWSPWLVHLIVDAWAVEVPGFWSEQ